MVLEKMVAVRSLADEKVDLEQIIQSMWPSNLVFLYLKRPKLDFKPSLHGSRLACHNDYIKKISTVHDSI